MCSPKLPKPKRPIIPFEPPPSLILDTATSERRDRQGRKRLNRRGRNALVVPKQPTPSAGSSGLAIAS